MKINKKLLLGGLIVLGIIIIIIILIFAEKRFNIKNSSQLSTKIELNTLNIKNAQAQSYSAPRIPIEQKGDKIFGSPDAKLKIFVYEDYTNIFSAKLADTLSKIKTKFANQVAIIVRPYFKNSVLSFSAAAAVDCAGKLGKWVEMRQLLFTNIKGRQSLSTNFSLNAKKIGLKVSNFNSCLAKSEKLGEIASSVKDSVINTIQGVPTMFIGQEMILGARPYNNYIDSNGDKIAGLEQVVEGQLKKLD